MKIFLDANILVSVLNQEYPLFSFSARILGLADHPGYQVYTSPICLAIAFYFSEKKSGSKLAKQKLELLVSRIQITTVNQEVVSFAVNDKRVVDFEDGLEYYSAIKEGCNVIITEDLNDFYYSEIEVLDCRGFLLKYFG
ncbi:MAG TPA: PIN domain-containing protein [Anditalea sp.]|nr:PIN domain-containing protein [Anditalea sp.]